MHILSFLTSYQAVSKTFSLGHSVIEVAQFCDKINPFQTPTNPAMTCRICFRKLFDLLFGNSILTQVRWNHWSRSSDFSHKIKLWIGYL